ncbi:WXG100 family type VII secretion target [Nocardia sp. 004]|uniref:WXG100 family type VII secretion target n=1 Tax=Nocardia sp. 004 TaxID=3385978 RepID=UPI00399F7826
MSDEWHLTRTNVTAWKTEQLVALADTITKGNGTFDYQISRMTQQFADIGPAWTGRAHNAAYDRVTEDRRQAMKVKYETDDLTTVLTQAADRLFWERDNLLWKVADVEAPLSLGISLPATVEDNWQISLRWTGNETQEQRNDAEEKAKGHQDLINAAWNELRNAAHEVDRLIRAAAQQIRDAGSHFGDGVDAPAIPGTADTQKEPTAGDGIEDGKAIADGTATDAEIQRITDHLAQAGLTPEQLEAMGRGEEITVPQSTLSYLRSFYENAGKDGLLTLSTSLQANGSPEALGLQRSIAAGMMTVSNEQIVSKNAMGEIQGRGSWDYVPEEIKELVSTRPYSGIGGGDTNSLGLPEGYDGPGATIAYNKDMSAFASLLNSADQGYQPGDKFSVELSRQAAYQAWLADDPGSGVGYVAGGMPDQLGDEAIQNLLGAGTRNHDANYALITGNGSPELLGEGYHRDQLMVPLIQHDWDDDGAALGDMFNWIDDNAHVAPGQTPSIANIHAGEAAFGVSQLLSTDRSGFDGDPLYANWLDMPGHEKQSLGQVNPELVKAMAEGLSPYTGKLVDMPDYISGTKGFGDLGGPAEAVRVMTILSGDPTASAIINGAALNESQRLDQQFAAQEIFGEGNPRSIYYGNRLHWLVGEALDTEFDDRHDDAQTTADDRKARFNTAYTAAQIMVGGFGPTQAGVAAVAELARNPIVDAIGFDPETVSPYAPMTFDGGTYDHAQFGTEEYRKYVMLQQLTNQGIINFDSLPMEFKNEDGTRFKPYFELEANDDYNSQLDLDNALNDIDDRLVGAGVDRERLEAYLERYDSETVRLNQVMDSPGTIENSWPHI